MPENPSTDALEVGYSKRMLHSWYQFVMWPYCEPDVTEFESQSPSKSRRHLAKSSTIETSVPVLLRCSVV